MIEEEIDFTNVVEEVRTSETGFTVIFRAKQGDLIEYDGLSYVAHTTDKFAVSVRTPPLLVNGQVVFG